MSAVRTRVLVVSPQEIVALGLAALLARHPDRVEVVTGPGPDGADPDVVLYDAAALAGGPGEDLRRLVVESASAVLAVAHAQRPDLAARASALGADGFVSLGVDDHELVVAVESASTGWFQETIEPDAAPSPAPGADPGADANRHEAGVGLTAREIEVLTLIVAGSSNQEIAARHDLSINSVKTYIRSAYRRIGVATRSQAVVWCLQHGFSAGPAGAPDDADGADGADRGAGRGREMVQIVATEPESTR